MLEFLMGKQPKAKLSALLSKAESVKIEQVRRGPRREALLGRLDAIRLDVATGETGASAELAAIDEEIAALVRQAEVSAGTLSDLDIQIAEARNAIAADTEATERTAQIKRAKADLKRVPAVFDEIRRLDTHRWALEQELAGMGTIVKAGSDLNAWQSEATSWLEWRAGMRERSPSEQATHDHQQEFKQAHERRKSEEAWRNSSAKKKLDGEAYTRAGWQVHDAVPPTYDSEARDWTGVR